MMASVRKGLRIALHVHALPTLKMLMWDFAKW